MCLLDLIFFYFKLMILSILSYKWQLDFNIIFYEQPELFFIFLFVNFLQVSPFFFLPSTCIAQASYFFLVMKKTL
jgi:hypothetical protein